MIHVLAVLCKDMWSPEIYREHMHRMPPEIRAVLNRYRDQCDAQRSLLGKLLLLEGLRVLKMERYTLRDLLYTEYGRPWLGPEVDFNISHSGDYIACAIGVDEKVGLDVEEIKDVPFEDFSTQFSAAEWSTIWASADPLRQFYRAWTQKEAFLKSLGTGLQTPLHEISTTGMSVTHQGHTRHTVEVPLHAHYMCHLATVAPNSPLSIHHISLNDLGFKT